MRARIESGGRSGIALAAVVVISLALALLAHGLLLVTRSEALLLRWDGERLADERLGSAALARAAAELDTFALAATAPGMPASGIATWPGGAASATVHRRALSPELVILSVPPDRYPGAAARSLILWSPDPRLRAEGRVAVVVSPGLRSGSGASLTVPRGTGSCGLSHSMVRPYAPPGGTPFSGTASFTHPSMGPVDLERLIRRMGGVPAQLTLDSTRVGLVVVDGPVELLPGATLEGWLMAAGSVRIHAGAALTGAVDAGGIVTIDPGGSILGDPCVFMDALVGAPGLRRPWRIGPEAWPHF